MAESELNIILRLVDEASSKLKQVTDQAKQGVEGVGNKSKEASTKVSSFNEQMKDASSKLRDFRRTAFLATAALATIISSVNEAAQYNQQAKNTFDSFTASVKSFSATLGIILEPALQLATKTISFLRDTLESTVAGFVKATAFVAEFFTQIAHSKGPVEDFQRALEVANLAADQFLRGSEETRAKIQAGLTLDKQAEQTINLEKIVVKASKTMKQHWEDVKDAVYDFMAALSEAEVLGKGFAKAAAAIAIGMAIVNTAQGITAALAGPPVGPPWPLNLALAALISATGAIQIATIAAQKFHSGGMIRAHNGLAVDEVPIIAQTGEGILSRQGMAAIGGESALNSINRGESGAGGMTVNVYYPKMTTREEVAELARALGFEIERQLRYARAL